MTLKPLSKLLLSLAIASVTSDAVAQCNPSSVATCGLPFPSAYWSEADAGSPTGVRLAVSDQILRTEVLEQLPAADGYTPAGIFNGDTGFSAATSALFEFENAPDPESLPADGGEAIRAFNLTTGEEIPIRVKLSDYAASDFVSAPSNVVVVHPVSRWNFGAKVLVIVTKSLAVAGETSDFQAVLDASAPGSAEHAYLQQLSEHIQQSGISLSDARNATVFQVRDRAEVVDPLRALVDEAYDAPQTIRNLNVRYNYDNADIHALVTGELRLYGYRTNGGTGKVDFHAQPAEQWTTFRLTVPAAARKGGAPVALYAHGLGGNKDSDSRVFDSNAELGIATFGIDFPNHGDRIDQDGGGVFDNLVTERIGGQVGMVNQNPIDFAAAQKALQSELAHLDIAKKPTWWNWWGRGKDNVPDLDTSRIMMQGTSLGGVLGMTYAALAPDMKAVAFQVAGIGITGILSDSILWELAFAGLVPSRANGAEALLMQNAIQQELDYGDPINYAELFRHPDKPREARPMLLMTGAGDSVVPNPSSTAAANLIDLPLVGEKLYDMPGVEVQDDYDPDGFGVRHYKALIPSYAGSNLSAFTGHVAFFRASVGNDQDEWISRFFLNN